MSTDTSISEPAENGLTKEQIWDRTELAIHEGFRQSETTLIEAPPTAGKSYGAIKWAAQTGQELTVLAPRHDLLDEEYEGWCEEFGLDYERLPSFYRDCESFDENDEPINEEAEQLQEKYKRGVGGDTLHERGSDWQCQKNGECQFVEKRDKSYDDVDVLLGTYRHAQVEDWIDDRYVVFDEFPGNAFLTEFEGDLPRIVRAYLDDDERLSLPFRTYRDLLSRSNNAEVQSSIEDLRKRVREYPFDHTHALKGRHPSANAFGPLATLAVIEMDILDNDWGVSHLDNGHRAVSDPEGDWVILSPPDLEPAESVIGLDGTPNIDLWEMALNEEMQRLEPLTQDEKRCYLTDVLGYDFVQTTENWKAIQGGDGAAPKKDMALLEGIKQHEGRKPTLITSKKAIRKYRGNGLNELTDMVDNYGNLKGMNDFSQVILGVVLGNPHPSDDIIQMWSALAGYSAERKSVDGEVVEGTDTDFGEFGNRVMKTVIHDEVLQAAMRFGREEMDGDQGATVYIHTAAIPEWVPVEKQIAEIDSWKTEKDGMPQVIEAIRTLNGWKHEEWKATDLYEKVEISKRQVRSHLESLASHGYIERLGKKGRGNALHYANLCLDDAGVFGHVEFAE